MNKNMITLSLSISDFVVNDDKGNSFVKSFGFDQDGNHVTTTFGCDKDNCNCAGTWTNGSTEDVEFTVDREEVSS